MGFEPVWPATSQVADIRMVSQSLPIAGNIKQQLPQGFKAGGARGNRYYFRWSHGQQSDWYQVPS